MLEGCRKEKGKGKGDGGGGARQNSKKARQCGPRFGVLGKTGCGKFTLANWALQKAGFDAPAVYWATDAEFDFGPIFPSVVSPRPSIVVRAMEGLASEAALEAALDRVHPSVPVILLCSPEKSFVTKRLTMEVCVQLYPCGLADAMALTGGVRESGGDVRHALLQKRLGLFPDKDTLDDARARVLVERAECGQPVFFTREGSLHAFLSEREPTDALCENASDVDVLMGAGASKIAEAIAVLASKKKKKKQK